MNDLPKSFGLPELYFGDEVLVSWPGCENRPFAMAVEANEARLRLVKALCGSMYRREECIVLAQRLAECDVELRCGSGACPCCLRAHQRWFTQQAAAIMKGREKYYVIGSIIPTLRNERLLETYTRSLYLAEKRISKALRYAGVQRALGIIDLSFNERKGRPEKWRRCAHGHLVISVKERAIWDKRLHDHFPRTKGVYRPVMLHRWEDKSPRIFSYMLRFNLDRRISSKATSNGNKIVRANVKRRELTAAQKVEAARQLDRFGIVGRIILFGFRIDVSRDVPAFVRASATPLTTRRFA